MTLPAAITGLFPLNPVLKMAFFEPVLPMESLMACLVFRQMLLQPPQPDSVETFPMVMTTVVLHAEELDPELPV